MATKRTRNPALLLSIILSILACTTAQSPAPSPTPRAESPEHALAVTPTPSSPAPSVAPTPTPTVAPTNPPPSTMALQPPSKCPLLQINLIACVPVALEAANTLSRAQCCSQMSGLPSSTAAACLCGVLKVDARVTAGVNITPIIRLILNVCGKREPGTVICVR